MNELAAGTLGAPSTRFGPAELRLIGGFRLVVDGATVPVPPTGQRLLAFLGLRGPCVRTHAAGTLWGERGERRALACLRTTIWRLGRTGLALTGPDSDQLREPPGLRVDTQDLAAVVAGWKNAGLHWRPGAEPIRQDLLPGWYDDWVIMERERVRLMLIATVEARSEEAVDAGDPATGLAWALLAVRIDPLRESAHRLVIAAHAAAGNLDAARRHVRRAQRLLRDELGVGPSRQFRALACSVGVPATLA